MKRFLAVFLIMALVLSGCGAGGSSDSAPSSADRSTAAYSGGSDPDGAYGYYEAEFDEARAYELYESDSVAHEAESTAIPSFLSTANSEGIKLVYTVDMVLQTTSFADGTRKLLHRVEDAGGFVRSTYVEGRSLYTPDAPRYARYTLSIPTDELAVFLEDLEDTYNLVLLSQDSRDITKRYATGNNELAYLQREEAELQAQIGALGEEDEGYRRELQQELSNLQKQIDSQQLSVDGMDISIHYSTVTVQLYEVVGLENALADVEKTPFGERFQATAGNSLNSFVGMLQELVLWLLSIWPGLLVLAALALLCRMGWRFAHRTKIGAQVKNSASKILGNRDEEINSDQNE